jgi:hypothetical protein
MEIGDELLPEPPKTGKTEITQLLLAHNQDVEQGGHDQAVVSQGIGSAR